MNSNSTRFGLGWLGLFMAGVCVTLTLQASGQSSDNLVPEGAFDAPGVIEGEHWRSIRDGKPAISVRDGALKGMRSNSGGWGALARDFAHPQERVLVEFSFAFFSPGDGRSLNLWSHEPGGVDARQFNLCIQGSNQLMQYDGRTRTWETISYAVRPSPDSANPIWHRLRAILDADASGIDYWLSKPGSRQLPEEPPARMATYRSELPIGGLDFVSGTRIAPGAWYLIDDLVVRGGRESIPAPAGVCGPWSVPPSKHSRNRTWFGPSLAKSLKSPKVVCPHKGAVGSRSLRPILVTTPCVDIGSGDGSKSGRILWVNYGPLVLWPLTGVRSHQGQSIRSHRPPPGQLAGEGTPGSSLRLSQHFRPPLSTPWSRHLGALSAAFSRRWARGPDG